MTSSALRLQTWLLKPMFTAALDREPDWQAATDTDGDGPINLADNCTLVANANQHDTQTIPAGSPDGYGNICDPGLDNSGTVDINDLNRLKSFLGKPPGPSGLHPNCSLTCP